MPNADWLGLDMALRGRISDILVFVTGGFSREKVARISDEELRGGGWRLCGAGDGVVDRRGRDGSTLRPWGVTDGFVEWWRIFSLRSGLVS